MTWEFPTLDGKMETKLKTKLILMSIKGVGGVVVGKRVLYQ